MKNTLSFLVPTFLSLAFGVFGQTSTSCNPLNTTCPEDSALGKTITVDFTQGESSEFTIADGTTITYGDNGAEFTITSAGLARTITSKNYIFFGKVDITMKAAPGQGIVSSLVMESDDLDEIDLEWLGGDSTQVETNYFGKDNTTLYNRATWPSVSDPQNTWHTYTIDWTSASIKWSVDGTLVRTLLYADALDGANFPQTPMQIKIGNWVGGAADEAEGTVEWAGGYTDLDDAPFTMYVKSITIQDYTTCATAYSYGDMTGSYESIVVHTNSSAASDTSCSAASGATEVASDSSSSSVASSSKASATAKAKASGSSSSAEASSSGAVSLSNSTTTAVASSSGTAASGLATSTTSSAAASSTTSVGSVSGGAAGTTGPMGFMVTALGLGFGIIVMFL